VDPAHVRVGAAWGALLVFLGAAACSDAGPALVSDGGADATTSPLDGAPPDASPPGDAGAPDAAPFDGSSSGDDGGVPGDGGPPVDGDTCDAAGQCGPGVVTSAPAYVPPAPTQQGVCTPQQIDDYFNNCFSATASNYSCNAWLSDPDAGVANQTCASCVFTDSTAGAWGPFVYFVQVQNVDFNFGGCMAVLDPSQNACAESVELDQECDYAACPQCFDVNALYQCMAVADSVPCACASYAQATGCANGEVDGGPAAACFSLDVPTYYYATVPVFCGSASDAGAPADN
jgi:hypothetical protein